MSSTIPLFVHQPFCESRRFCKDCRAVNPRFRDSWAAKYAMPASWPECPFGIPFGYTPALPISPSALGVVTNAPETPEAKAITAKVMDRADKLLPICRACPGGFFLGVSGDGITVDCAAGSPGCCGKCEPKRGLVHLGIAPCLKAYW